MPAQNDIEMQYQARAEQMDATTAPPSSAIEVRICLTLSDILLGDEWRGCLHTCDPAGEQD